MDYPIIKRFYSEIQANIYYMRLKDSGIKCFLSNKNSSHMLPLSNGGIMLHVSINQLHEAKEIIRKMDNEVYMDDDHEDYREATEEDIQYLKQVNDYNRKLENASLNIDQVKMLLLLLLLFTILILIVNYLLLNK